MHFRSFVLLGLCAAFGLALPAMAETSPPSKKTYLFASSAAGSAGDSATQTLKGKKKKLSAKDKAKAAVAKSADDDKAAKAAAKAKAEAMEAAKAAQRERAKMAMRERAIAAARAAAAPKVQNDDAKLAVAEKPLAKPAKLKKLNSIEPQPQPVDANVVATGNNGELRSETASASSRGGFFQILFGDETTSVGLLPQTRALDTVLAEKQARKKFKVRPEFEPTEVDFSGYAPGTIVINTGERRLYLVESSSTARRYAIAVGREGLQFKGSVTVGDKQEWPRWIPTLDMQKREPKHYGPFKDGMPGGPDNPLGARAIYLYQGKTDTHLRIHGTNQPQSIGTSASNGCFRMINAHVMDLYSRVKVGTPVVVL